MSGPTAHDAGIPYTDVNPDVEIRKFLLEGFKARNWFARNYNLVFFVPALLATLPLLYAHYAVDPKIYTEAQLFNVYAGAFVMVWFLAIAGLFIMALCKHFFHDRPLQKYKQEWSID